MSRGFGGSLRMVTCLASSVVSRWASVSDAYRWISGVRVSVATRQLPQFVRAQVLELHGNSTAGGP